MRFSGGMSTRPLVIAHRGVPGERLEHTRPSYLLAIEQGADYIEPDVVSTSDGVLVVRHENEIGTTTDVSTRPEFADRKTTKTIDGVPLTGWFTEDFTLDEVKTLWVRERLPKLRPRNLPLEGQERILTFDEVVEIAERGSETSGREIGVYVETKHPTYFAEIGLDLNDLLIADLERRGLNRDGAAVIIQSKEVGNLRTLRDRTPLALIQLMDRAGAPWDLVAAGDPRTFADLVEPAELTEIATYADGIGPNKSMVVARDADHRLAGATGLVDDAHEAGLLVHIWTMRDENNFLPTDLRLGGDKAAHGDAVGEYLVFFDAGIDGVFSDFTQTAVRALGRWESDRSAG